MRSLRLIPLVALVALALAPAAGAHRLAHPAEKAGMIYSASGRYYHGVKVAEPRSVPLRCFVADVATVVKGGTWGAWTFSNYAYSHAKKCRAGNGWAVEHKLGGRWYVYWEGDEGYPAVKAPRGYRGVPRKIAKDLKAGLP